MVFGSHNLEFKASYSNDENLVIVRGHKALAEAYAVHVLDVYDHYRFRAAEAELRAEGKKGWDGFLSKKDDWQDSASKILPIISRVDGRVIHVSEELFAAQRPAIKNNRPGMGGQS